MKKLLTILLGSVIALPSMAEFTGNGFYRIKNFKSERFAYMLDNKAIVDMGATSVDVSAIELWKNIEKAQSDASTVIYVEKVGSQYDIAAQGTSVHQMLNEYLNLREDSSNPGIYYAYGSYNGLTKYLSDGTLNTKDEHSYLADSGTGDYKKWDFVPMSTDTDNYFGFVPTASGTNGNFTTIYMGYDLTLKNANTKAYIITYVDNKRGYAIYDEIKGAIPAKRAVLIQLDGDKSSNNKAVPSLAAVEKTGTNYLGGTFFDNTRKGHENNTKHDADKMRVLGKLSDGSVGFVKDASRKYVERNTAYLNVGESCPAEVRLVTQAEYDYILANETVEATSVKLNKSELSLKVGEESTLTATVSPDNTTDKTVTWKSNNTSVATVDNNGKVKAVASGTAEITATCGSVSAKCTVTVSKFDQSITWNQTFGTVQVGDKITLNATASSGLAVTYTIVSGPATVSGNTVTINGSGVITVQADQAGNATYNAAAPVTKTITVGSKTQEITWDQTFGDVKVGDEITLTATATSGLAVTYTVLSGDASVSNNVLTVKGAGVIKVEASQAGNETYVAAASVTKELTVTKYDQAITWEQPFGDVKVGDEITLNASAASGLAVTYTVLSGNATIDNSVLTVNGAGLIKVEASQAGNEKYNAAASVIKEITATKYDQTITWDQDFGEEVKEGDVITLTATASSGLNVAYAVTKGSEIAKVEGNVLSILGEGEIEIVASQAGNEKYEAAESVSVAIKAVGGIVTVQGDQTGISIKGRTLEIKGGAANVSVYNLLGSKVYEGKAASVELPSSGTYLVVVGNRTYKILAK